MPRSWGGLPDRLWTGDALHGTRVQGRKTYLFAFIDDHSRAQMAGRWGFAENTVRLAAALRPALAARGVPEYIYVDNGSAFVDSWLLRACAKLGIERGDGGAYVGVQVEADPWYTVQATAAKALVGKPGAREGSGPNPPPISRSPS